MKVPKFAKVQFGGENYTILLNDKLKDIDILSSTLYGKYVNGTDLVNFFTQDKIVEDVWRGTVEDVCRGTIDNVENEFSYEQNSTNNNVLQQKIVTLAGRIGVECKNEIDRVIATGLSSQFNRVNTCDYPASNFPTCGKQPIVLLLESPHKDEYFYFGDDFLPIVPANGRTGDAIERKLKCILTYICSKGQYGVGVNLLDLPAPLIICNPVPFQTSLHFLHGKPLNGSAALTLRNNVWTELWGMKSAPNGCPVIIKDFVKRIRSYRPQLIINACTSDLTGMVQSALDIVPSLRAIPKCRVYHPAINWNCRKYGPY